MQSQLDSISERLTTLASENANLRSHLQDFQSSFVARSAKIERDLASFWHQT